MKKGVIAVSILITAVLLGSVCYGEDGDEIIVKDLINKRTEILSLYYAGKTDKEETMEKIKVITTDFLQQEDLKNVEKYFQCDLEQVIDYEIMDVDITYSDEDVICAYVTIDWKSEGLKGHDDFSHKYSVICEKQENLYKLAQFF